MSKSQKVKTINIFGKVFWIFRFWTFIFVHFEKIENRFPKKVVVLSL